MSRNSPRISSMRLAWLSIVCARRRDFSLSSSRKSNCAWPRSAANGLLISCLTRDRTVAVSVIFVSYSETSARRRASSFASWGVCGSLISFLIIICNQKQERKGTARERETPRARYFAFMRSRVQELFSYRSYNQSSHRSYCQARVHDQLLPQGQSLHSHGCLAMQ